MPSAIYNEYSAVPLGSSSPWYPIACYALDSSTTPVCKKYLHGSLTLFQMKPPSIFVLAPGQVQELVLQTTALHSTASSSQGGAPAAPEWKSISPAAGNPTQLCSFHWGGKRGKDVLAKLDELDALWRLT